MSYKKLFENWNAKDTKVTASNVEAGIGRRLGARALLISLAFVGTQTVIGAMTPTEDKIFDKISDSYTFNSGEVINGLTLKTILDRMDDGFDYSVVVGDKGYSNISSTIKSKHAHEQNPIVACEVHIDKEQFKELKELATLFTDKELHTYVYLHEQAHCVDNAEMLSKVEEYKSDIKKNLGDKDDYWKELNRQVLKESYADTYSLLMMSVKNPESSEKYINAIKQFREKDKKDVIKTFDNQFSAYKRYDHDTLKAIDVMYDTVEKLDINGLNKLMATKEGTLVVENEISKIASMSASLGFKMWIAENGNSGKGRLVSGGTGKESEYHKLNYGHITEYQEMNDKVIEKTNNLLAKNSEGLNKIQSLRLQFSNDNSILSFNKNKYN